MANKFEQMYKAIKEYPTAELKKTYDKALQLYHKESISTLFNSDLTFYEYHSIYTTLFLKKKKTMLKQKTLFNQQLYKGVK